MTKLQYRGYTLRYKALPMILAIGCAFASFTLARRSRDWQTALTLVTGLTAVNLWALVLIKRDRESNAAYQATRRALSTMRRGYTRRAAAEAAPRRSSPRALAPNASAPNASAHTVNPDVMPTRQGIWSNYLIENEKRQQQINRL